MCQVRSGDLAETIVDLPRGACVRDALDASGLVPTDWTGPVGVFGAIVSLDRALDEGDRVEIYHALPVDPKAARRARAEARRRARR